MNEKTKDSLIHLGKVVGHNIGKGMLEIANKLENWDINEFFDNINQRQEQLKKKK